MRGTRSRRSTGVALLGALLSGLSGCSLVGNSNTSIGLWSVADLEEGLSALAAEASTDQVVEFRASPYALHLTLLPTAGEAEYLKWTGWEGEVTREDGVGGYDYPQEAATGTVALDDIDLEFIVENEPCERSTLEFTFRTLGVPRGGHPGAGRSSVGQAGEVREVGRPPLFGCGGRCGPILRPGRESAELTRLPTRSAHAMRS